MANFTPISAAIGGALIGLSAVLLMALHGRIAGMTGILSGVVPPLAPDWQWRAAFLVGAVLAPLAYIAAGGTIAFSVPVSTTALAVGGVIVAIGVSFGNGCPSGHGICGIARLSPRSLVAVPVFMATAFLTVFVTRHLMGA